MSEGNHSETVLPAPLPDFVPAAPFDDPNADVILRSSDGVDFRAHRLVLSLASPIFKQMFQLPQPQSEPEVPIIPLAESVLVLDRFLRFFYPGTESSVPNLEQLREILDIALIKYDMHSLASLGKQYLRSHISDAPVGVYAIACRYGWKDVALDAAKQSLQYPLRAFGAPPIQLHHITAYHYHTLLAYHTRCGQVATAATSTLTWLSNWQDLVFFNLNCTVCPRTNSKSSPIASFGIRSVVQWFAEYLDNAGELVGNIPAANLDDMRLLDSPFNNLAKCPSCTRNGVVQQLIQFAKETLPSEIKRRIDSVELTLDL
ncbi:hypothetical protein B0H15DRAFT_862767 [Mycena belliarum]|uniref:BTB domain-containing protein n=1 Tax=Mycena belliarum TaxID=1033014 RepID=A0AAD6XIJ3_9AGAR|nr:hypothetical protein B0H15DRAFT_862767 [Mycena belliae]